jgi:tetratricopeptide (TPR) repeat protein
LTIGVEAEALGRLEEAEENLQRASRTASDPNEKARAYLALFDFYREQGRVDEALAAWDQAWEGDGQESGRPGKATAKNLVMYSLYTR